MSFKISYAVAPCLPRDIVAPLGFQLGVETDALPYEEWFVGTLKENNQTLFWSEAEEFVSDVSAELAALSKTGDVIVCRVDEDAQTSQATCYHGGRKIWDIVKEAGADSLTATGDLPPSYVSVLEDLADKPFEVPLEVAKGVCGFRYDLDLVNRNFIRFFRITEATEAPPVAPKRGFFAKLLGR